MAIYIELILTSVDQGCIVKLIVLIKLFSICPLGKRNILVKKEEMARGSVILSVYLYLMKASGWSLAAFIIGFGIVNAFYLGKDFWLAKWSEEGERNPDVSVFLVD